MQYIKEQRNTKTHTRGIKLPYFNLLLGWAGKSDEDRIQIAGNGEKTLLGWPGFPLHRPALPRCRRAY